jgi:hypothetical protein
MGPWKKANPAAFPAAAAGRWLLPELLNEKMLQWNGKEKRKTTQRRK